MLPVNQIIRFSSNAGGNTYKDKFIETSNFAKLYVSGPTSAVSAGSGVLSFVLSNFFQGNEIVDKVAEWFSKIALFANAIYGGITNTIKRNIIGTTGYCCDLLTALFAPAEELYIWRGFGSALDQLPLFFETLSKNEKIKKAYNPHNDPEVTFSDYKNEWECLKKFFFGVGVTFSDSFNLIKESFSKKSLKSIFSVFKKADFNLIVSAAGILVGSTASLFFGKKTFGSITRDIFGLHADFAVWHGGVTGQNDEAKRRSGKLYQASGITYTIGTVIDLIYRFLPIENLHLAALGVDRLGSFFMAYANDEGNDNDKKTKAKKNNPPTDTKNLGHGSLAS